jgi:hypothetical protein
MKYEQWLSNPLRFKAMTGYTVEAFQALLPYFEQVHDRYLSTYQLNGKRRSGLRKFVLYANSPLPTIAERLAFILSYYKLNGWYCREKQIFDRIIFRLYTHLPNEKLGLALPSGPPGGGLVKEINGRKPVYLLNQAVMKNAGSCRKKQLLRYVFSYL